ncbi:MAG: hypothetical protein JO163_13755 [Methylobacteriaceae bacterium]|nr:hypothetical protein [Methylobacteriaceae bacterium]MBV9636646.1 hypothetical protein [Methylobacteriaceae bacterium]MBV9703790.1 hypothetical protein [Methylobacteriaceae bacterium]
MSRHVWPAVMCLALIVAMSFGLRYFRDTWFFLIGLLGVGIVFVAVQADLDKNIAGSAHAGSYARQMKEDASRAEKAARRSENRRFSGSLSIAKLIGVILAVFGFGGFLLAQYGGTP